jgi:hypothetical protein
VVGERFHVKPLLPLLTGDGRFYVLALSQNEIRLLRGTRDTVAEIELDNIPRGLEDALKYDVAEKQVQHRVAASERSGGRPAIFHGHGGEKDTAQSDLNRYFHKVDRGIMKILRGERAPLVLAGVDYIRSAYAQISEYPALMETGISGNPEPAAPADLHAAAWEIVKPHFAQVREAAATHYRQMAKTDRASDAIETILPAAYHGGVETLFVTVGRQRWGTYDPETNTVELHESQQTGDEDLLDHAAVHTLLNGGDVFAGETVPEGDEICAVFRYDVG